MKKGKTNKITGFKHIKAMFGTVDSKNFKSIYLNIQTWVEPKDYDIENWNRVISNLNRQIKHTVFEFLNKEYFEQKFILDLDLRSSGIIYGKKSFLNLEITFYIKNLSNFKSTLLKSELKKICQMIYFENFKNNEYFEFSISKKPKYDLEKIENI